MYRPMSIDLFSSTLCSGQETHLKILPLILKRCYDCLSGLCFYCSFSCITSSNDGVIRFFYIFFSGI